MPALITFDNVSFSYDGLPVLRNFSFTAERGERIVIKGESGTGKTTLFRLLLGFELPRSGEIIFDGRSISENGFTSVRKNTAWLPQDIDLGEGSVNNVINRPFEFNLNTNQKPGSAEIERTLTRLGLSPDILGKSFRDLSTGQRQRVGLALCHLLNRPLLLLDEPTSALDEASKQKVIDLLLTDTGRTIISTSHDPFWVERCDRVYNLD